MTSQYPSQDNLDVIHLIAGTQQPAPVTYHVSQLVNSPASSGPAPQRPPPYMSQQPPQQQVTSYEVQHYQPPQQQQPGPPPPPTAPPGSGQPQHEYIEVVQLAPPGGHSVEYTPPALPVPPSGHVVDTDRKPQYEQQQEYVEVSVRMCGAKMIELTRASPMATADTSAAAARPAAGVAAGVHVG